MHTPPPQRIRTRVAVIGAGPAGLSLAHMLALQGVDAVVLERSSEEHVRSRVRAGVLEQSTVDVFDQLGVSADLHREALRHKGFYLRFDRATHHLDFHADTGRNAFVYGQAKVVGDLIDALPGRAAPVIFDAEAVAVEGIGTDRPEVHFRTPNSTGVVEADFVAGCDGFHGVARATAEPHVRTVQRVYPFAWLGILAHSTPVTEEGMYSAHPDGLSLHSMRGPQLSRQYLQVPHDTDLAHWSDERIWKELRHRSAADDADELETGEIIERSLTRLRSAVTEPMRVGSLFLLGDAAHILPPTGAKGLNLAVSDACVLSNALGGYYADRRTDLLDAYSVTALERIWQTQAFSWRLTSALHRHDDEFDWPLRRARLQRWVASETARRELGEVYLGLPFPTDWRYR
ncbi:4-hydroxybenzoate 3-monooxygenase [Gordonia sp. LUNF6]|uniref:4-hydroxybenzoate 3-monooxygenase n=1 Tax=Gordonia sp. LUNF6 TaxID=3388658 RepID=UPI00399A9A62